MTRLTLLLAALLLTAQASAQELVFASGRQARVVLSTSDAYSRSMSDFDRSARLATPRTVTEKEFLEFAASAALDWDEASQAAVSAAYEDLKPAIARLRLPLPPRIYMVKTSGAEDAQAAYTRQNAVILPAKLLGTMRDANLRRLVAHELFHVSTRTNPELADALYAVLGFERCGPVVLPAQIAARRITNPDAPKDEHCIGVEAGGERVSALPVLVSTVSKDELATSGPFLQHVSAVLLLVERSPAGGPAKPLMRGGAARIVDFDEVTGFYEQVGRNTRYIIHPEEISADNFALLASGASKVPSPEILAAFERVLLKHAKAPQ